MLLARCAFWLHRGSFWKTQGCQTVYFCKSVFLLFGCFSLQYLIAHTEETLLLGNIENCKLSEILWHGSGDEKFLLDNPSICKIYDQGELALVEYGCNDILATVQTDHLQEALISIRLNNRKCSLGQPPKQGNNRMAYLLDLQTMHVIDLVRRVYRLMIT